MNRDAKIFVAGHKGFVGSAIVRTLHQRGYNRLILKTKPELDLRDSLQVQYLFRKEQPDYVFLAAAKVGGIAANRDVPADFIRDNLMIQQNVIDASYQSDVKKLLFLGSACIYPKLAPQPLKEQYLLTGALDETNEPYAIAKIAGIKMCQAYNKQYNTRYITAIPTSLYGPTNHFDMQTSHVMPALIRKFHEAAQRNLPQVEIGERGTARHEFLHVDDLANACLYLMEHYEDCDIVNVGAGEDISIRELAEKIKTITGYNGEIVYTAAQPDGTSGKLVDATKINGLGWQAKIGLNEGIRSAYAWFIQNESLLSK
ncbi:GDP-L-fucose synthase family protein [Paenibacillus montanisoli]|uniref:GDP-L-fucose synthase n=1 Tax=Paenibacillus montanisoli TaxID=2081970 RepID=A0A328U3E5_9BACL|nr:GDP-L-fucose synthase [Paenibacillus montanisoli]RAP77169.1 GDP-L-fucose synthase [Paenibacillus montanisoli]